VRACVCLGVWVCVCMCVWETDTSESFVSHIQISHVTHLNESCHTLEIVMVDRPIMSAFVCVYMCVCVYVCVCGRERERDTHLNEPSCTSEWVMSHMWVSRVTHVSESCHACEWVMSHRHHRVATIGRIVKLQVSFAEYRLFYRALLQKRPIL